MYLIEDWQTEADDAPLALIAFQGRLVAGVGKALRIYDMGKKKLLRKAENKVRLQLILPAALTQDFLHTDIRFCHCHSEHSRISYPRRGHAGVSRICRI